MDASRPLAQQLERISNFGAIDSFRAGRSRARPAASAQPRAPAPEARHSDPRYDLLTCVGSQLQLCQSVQEREPLMTHSSRCALSTQLTSIMSVSQRVAKQPEARETSPTCKYVLAVFLVGALLISQVICQTSPIEPNDCPHRHHKSRPVSTKSSQAGSAKSTENSFNPQRRLPEPHLARPMDRLAGAESNARQQRQFGLAKAAKLTLDQQAVGADGRSAPTSAEHEEFSLSLGGQAGTNPVNASNYSLIEPTTPSQSTSNTGLVQSASDNIGLVNTTPALPNDSIGSPVALQPPATTTSSIQPANSRAAFSSPLPTSELTSTTGNPSSQAQRRPAEQLSDDQQSSALAAPAPVEPPAQSKPDQENFQRHSYGFTATNSGAMSSSPSSISIITPLVGSSNQQQTHTTSLIAAVGATGSSSSDSSLVKPIFVLGNPISERDYNGPSSSSVAPSQPASNNAEAQAQPLPAATHPESVPSPPARSLLPSARSDKTAELEEAQRAGDNATMSVAGGGERMSGPPLVYSDGHLSTVLTPDQNSSASQHLSSVPTSAQAQQPASPRLLHGGGSNPGAAVLANNPRRPSLPPPVNQANAASGFRSPMSPSGSLIGSGGTTANGPVQQPQASLMAPANPSPSAYYQTAAAPYAGAGSMVPMGVNVFGGQNSMMAPTMGMGKNQLAVPPVPQVVQQQPQAPPITGSHASRRPLNITRVERK